MERRPASVEGSHDVVQANDCVRTSYPTGVVAESAEGTTRALPARLRPSAVSSEAVTSRLSTSSGSSTSSAKLPSAPVATLPPALVVTTAPAAGEPSGRHARPVSTCCSLAASRSSMPCPAASEESTTLVNHAEASCKDNTSFHETLPSTPVDQRVPTKHVRELPMLD